MSQAVVESLLVEISGRTVELEARLAGAEAKIAKFEATATRAGENTTKSFLNIASGIEPTTIALTTIGVVAVAALAKVSQMAAQTDGALRQVIAASPGAARSMEALGNTIEGVAQQTGRTREEIFAASQDIARLGVATEGEFKAKLNAATLISDATGTELKTAVEGVDQLSDAFDLSADQIVGAVAKIASASRGRVDFDAIFGVLQSSVPQIEKLGLKFDTAIKVIVAALDKGYNARGVKKLFTEQDTASLERFAQGAHISANALNELNAAADVRRNGADRQMQAGYNELAKTMSDLGRETLPLVLSELKGVVGLVSLLSGTKAKLEALPDVTTLRTIGDNSHMTGDDPQRLIDAAGRLNEAFKHGAVDLTSMEVGELQSLLRGLDKAYQTQVTWAGKQKNSAFELREISGTYDKFTGAIVAAIAARGKFSAGQTPDHPTGAGTLGLTNEEKAKAQSELDASEKAISEFRVGIQEAIAGGTKSAVDNAIADLAKFNAKALETRKALLKALATKGVDASQLPTVGQFDDEVRQENARRLREATRLQVEEGQAVRRKVLDVAADATGNAADVARRALEDQNGEILKLIDNTKAISNEEKNHLRAVQATSVALKTENIDATEASERLKQTVQSIQGDQANGQTPTASKLAALNAASLNASQKMRELEAKGLTSSKAYLDYAQQIRDAEKTRRDLLAQIAGIDQSDAKAAERTTEKIQEQARAIQQAVDGALQLGEAFGLVNKRVGDILRSASQVATGLGPALDQLKNFQSGALGTDGKPLATLGSLVGSFLPVAGGLASLISGLGLFGDSPEDKARKDAIEKNTIALRELTKTTGLLGTAAISYAGAADAVQVARKALGGLDSRSVGAGRLDAVQLSLSADQTSTLEAAAKSLGLTFDGTVGSLRQLQVALESSIDRIGEFGSSFDDVNAELDASRKILGDQGPLANLKALLSGQGKNNASFAALGGLNLDSAGGRADLRNWIQGVFEQMKNGGGTLPPEVLGGLSGSQFLQTLEQLTEYLNQLDPAAATASEQLGKLRGDLTTEFDILGTDSAHQLEQLQNLYGGQGGALSDLMKGLDPTKNAGDISTLEDRIKALFKQIQDAPDTVDTGTLSISDLIAALVDLMHSAQNAAAGVKTAAQQMQEAADTLQTDFDVFGTDAVGQATGVAGLYASVGGIGDVLKPFDLTTAGGRAGADTALQELYKSNKSGKNDPAVTSAIQAILHAIRAVPQDKPAEGDSASSAAGSSGGGGDQSRITDASRSITEQTGNRMADYLASILSEARALPENFVTAMQRVFSQAGGQLLAPAIPFGGFGQGGGTQINNRFYTTVVIPENLVRAGITSATKSLLQDAGDQFAQTAIDKIDQALGDRFRSARQLTGNPVVS